MFSAEQLDLRAKALKLSEQHPDWGFNRIAMYLGVTKYKLNCEMIPGYSERYREQQRKIGAERRLREKRRKAELLPPDMSGKWRVDPEKCGVRPFWGTGMVGETRSVFIPEHVLADREARMMTEHTDLTAVLCGDPLPGRSALDRKRG